MKPIHLDHLLEMVNKFEQEKGHKFGVKRIQRVQAICFVHTCYLVFYLKAPFFFNLQTSNLPLAFHNK
jgi:hypothetical protein